MEGKSKQGQCCQVCGSPYVKSVTDEEEFEYKGFKIIIPYYTTIICNKYYGCGEEVATKASVMESVRFLRDAKRVIDNYISGDE